MADYCRVYQEYPGGEFTVRFWFDDRGTFWQALAQLKRDIPHYARTFNDGTRMWVVDSDFVRELRRWADDWYASSEQHWQVRHQPPPAAPPPSSGPWAALFLVPGAPMEVVSAAYRALSKIYHPDVGGDVRRMQEINAAYEELRKTRAPPD